MKAYLILEKYNRNHWSDQYIKLFTEYFDKVGIKYIIIRGEGDTFEEKKLSQLASFREYKDTEGDIIILMNATMEHASMYINGRKYLAMIGCYHTLLNGNNYNLDNVEERAQSKVMAIEIATAKLFDKVLVPSDYARRVAQIHSIDAKVLTFRIGTREKVQPRKFRTGTCGYYSQRSICNETEMFLRVPGVDFFNGSHSKYLERLRQQKCILVPSAGTYNIIAMEAVQNNVLPLVCEASPSGEILRNTALRPFMYEYPYSEKEIYQKVKEICALPERAYMKILKEVYTAYQEHYEFYNIEKALGKFISQVAIVS